MKWKIGQGMNGLLFLYTDVSSDNDLNQLMFISRKRFVLVLLDWVKYHDKHA